MTGAGADDALDAVTEYYEALDAGAYDDLAALLRPGFVHYRPDRTLEGRDRFVAFMRDERPMTDTTHELCGLFEAVEGDCLAARGRLLDAEGRPAFGFVDVHAVEGASIATIHTYTR